MLRYIAGQLGGIDAVAHQALLDAPHFILAIGEDHHPLPAVVVDQVVQQLVLVGAGYGVDVLLDVGVGDVLGFDLDDRRVGGPLLGQVHHVVGEGGGEQQGLAFALGRGLANDLPHLGDEAHVEHAVGFVQHHHLDHVQVHVAALVEVQQAAGGGHQDVAVAGFELLELLVEVHAADEGHHVQAGVLGQRRGVLGDLHHQFPGRRDDQRPRLAHVAFLGRRGLQQLGDDRDQERGGLAGTGLGATDGVLARQGEAQHLGLDRRAVGEAQVVDGMHQFRGELEIMETGLAFLGLDHEVLELPGADRWFRGAWTTLLGLGFFRARRLGSGRGGRCGHRFFFSGGSGRAPFRLVAVMAAAGRGDGSAGAWRAWLCLAFTEDLLECFEHGHLINWLRNVRRPV